MIKDCSINIIMPETHKGANIIVKCHNWCTCLEFGCTDLTFESKYSKTYSQLSFDESSIEIEGSNLSLDQTSFASGEFVPNMQQTILLLMLKCMSTSFV